MMDNVCESERFYKKLIQKASESGGMRWNAICEDIINIYLHEIPELNRMVSRDFLWDLLFNPQENENEKRKEIKRLFQNEQHRDYFMNRVYIGIDDPIGWDKWVSHFTY